MAERSRTEVERLVPSNWPPLTEHIRGRHGLLADLSLIRERGYAIDNEEGAIGLRCFGVALRYESPVMDAISCSVPTARLTTSTEDKIIDALREARAAIERGSWR